ncbi:MAG: Ig-like domain-containing protein [Ignavibacteria bacterium]
MKYKIFFSIIISFILYGCANQLPPSGGDDDRIPPKIIYIYPKPNSVNFHDNKIILRFDEYVDRRSLEESFLISPKPDGETEFNWSGKEVEIGFSRPLRMDKTYVIVIGNELRDVRGSNTITSPVSFAFSTGDKIDDGSISGKVLSDNFERIKIMAYIKSGKQEDSLNPEINLSDYIKQVSPDGSYKLSNLPDGAFRLFAITDEDRNNLYDKDIDKISILPKDLILTNDSNNIEEVNFLLKSFEPDKFSKDFISLLQPDSLNFISANIKNNEKDIPPDYRFYFYFRNNKLTKPDIVNNFTLKDTASDQVYRPVFNWINDSLVEVFTNEKLKSASSFEITIDLSATAGNYIYKVRFHTAANNSFGKLSGKIITEGIPLYPVYVQLFNKENVFISYSKKITDSIGFSFDEILAGNYTLFSFMDKDENGRFDKGNYFPFTPAEGFIIYGTELKIKGGWNIDNVFLNY